MAYCDGVCRVCHPNHVTLFGLTSPTSVLFRRDHFDESEDSDPVPCTCDFLYTVRLGNLCTPHVTSLSLDGHGTDLAVTSIFNVLYLVQVH